MNRKINHVAIIMDGNGRWAEIRGKNRIEGHKAGADSVKMVMEAAREKKIKFLTLFAFSTENWKRPKLEINGLFELLTIFLKENLKILKQNKIKFKVIGRINEFPKKLKELLEKTENETKYYETFNLILALNYGGKAEIVDTTKKIVEKVIKNEIKKEDINEKMFTENLYFPNSKDPEILVRTGGEKRISNFLLWEISYTEIFFINKYWPDFTKEDFNECIKEFYQRKRKYGKV